MRFIFGFVFGVCLATSSLAFAGRKPLDMDALTPDNMLNFLQEIAAYIQPRQTCEAQGMLYLPKHKRGDSNGCITIE